LIDSGFKEISDVFENQSAVCLARFLKLEELLVGKNAGDAVVLSFRVVAMQLVLCHWSFLIVNEMTGEEGRIDEIFRRSYRR